MKAQNLDRLSRADKALVALCFHSMPVGWTNAYMVEVRLDNPQYNMLHGGDGFCAHGGNGSRCYLHHAGDPNWAIVHIEDEDWQQEDQVALLEEAKAIIQNISEPTA